MTVIFKVCMQRKKIGFLMPDDTKKKLNIK